MNQRLASYELQVAMDFLVENSSAVIDKIPFDDAFPPALIRDAFAAVARGMKKIGVNDGDGSGKNGISELRQEAHEKGLIVDGSRKILYIAALSREPN